MARNAPEPKIRPYRESDRETLKAITIAAFPGVSIDWRIEQRYGVIGGKDWRVRKARHIDADADANPNGIFVAEIEREIVGYVTSRVDSDARIGWIPNLAVSPEHQGTGIGRRLMEVCLDYLRREGMEFVRIETLAHNEVGSAFYPRMGFREICRQIHYIMPLQPTPTD